MPEKQKIETVEGLREEIGVDSDSDEQTVTKPTTPMEQSPAPAHSTVARDMTGPLQGDGTESVNKESAPERSTPPQRGDIPHQQTSIQQDKVVQQNNISSKEVAVEQEAVARQAKKLSHHTGTEQELAEKRTENCEEQLNIRSSSNPVNRLDRDRANHSHAAQGDEEELAGYRAEEKTSDKVRKESSHVDGASPQDHQGTMERLLCNPQALTSPCSIHFRTSGVAEAGSSDGVVGLHAATRDEEASNLQERDLAVRLPSESIQRSEKKLQVYLNRSMRIVSSADASPLPLTPTCEEEPNRIEISGDENASSEAQLQEQDPVKIYFVQGRTPDAPPQMNNDTPLSAPNSSKEGTDDQQDSGNVEGRMTHDHLIFPPAPTLSPPNPVSTLSHTSRTTENTGRCALETPVNIMPLGDPRPSTHIENIRTPAAPISSSSSRLTPDDRDDREKRERSDSENTRDRCKPQEHQKKDNDDDESDQNDYNTPKASRTAIGKSRKLSPSASEDQPRKRRSCSGAEPEEGEILEGQGGSQFAAQSTACKCSSKLNAIDDRKIQELTPSKTPDRQREYTSPPGMPPVSRLELPENFPAEPPQLGSGRRYQRANMPTEYVPPRLDDVVLSSESSRSGGEDNLNDDSEAEDEVDEERANGEALQRTDDETRAISRSLIPSATDTGNSGQQKRPLTSNPTLIPPRRNPQVLQIRSEDVHLRVKQGGHESPEIEAWTESPKLPPPRNYGNQEVIRAKNTLVYRVTLETPSHRISSHGRRVAEAFGRDNVFEILRDMRGATGMMRSNFGNPHLMTASNSGTQSNALGLLNNERSSGAIQRMNQTRSQGAAQTSNARLEMVNLGHLLGARNEARNRFSGDRNAQA